MPTHATRNCSLSRHVKLTHYLERILTTLAGTVTWLESPNKNNPCLVASEQEQPRVKRNNQKTHGSAVHEILRISGIKPRLILFRKNDFWQSTWPMLSLPPCWLTQSNKWICRTRLSPKLLTKLHLSTCATGSTRPTPSMAKLNSTNIFHVATS